MNSRSCIPQLRTGCGGQERRANRCAISLGQPHGHHFAAPPPRDRFAVAQGAHGLGWLDPARPGWGGRRPPGPGRHGRAGAAGPQRDEHPTARTCGARATRHGVLDGLIAQGLRTPKFPSADGGAGLDRVLAALWRGVAAQRWAVHEHKNLLAHAPDALHKEVSSRLRRHGKPQLMPGHLGRSTQERGHARCSCQPFSRLPVAKGAPALTWLEGSIIMPGKPFWSSSTTTSKAAALSWIRSHPAAPRRWDAPEA